MFLYRSLLVSLIHPSVTGTVSMATEDTPLLVSPQPATNSDIKRVVLACSPMLLLTAADSAFMLASFPTLGSQFGHLDDVPWGMIAYQVGVIFGQSVYSRLSDQYSRRRVLLLAHFLFIIGIGCQCLAPNFWVIVGARSITGLGTAGMPLMLNTILNDICSEKTRSAWHGINPLGQLLGAVGGGYIVDHYGWQIAFQGEFVWAVLSFLIVWWCLPHGRLDDSRIQCNIRAAPILALSLISLVFCLDNDLAGVVVPLIPFIAFSLAFWWLERNVTPPLLPWKRLRDKPMAYVIGIAPITAFIDMSILNLVPYYAQISNLRTVMAIGGLSMVFTVGEILGHLLCSSIQRDRHVFISSRALSCLSVGVLLSNKDWVKLVGLILAGFSSGLANGTSITMIMRYTQRKGVERDRCILYGVFHLVIAMGNLLAQSMIIWLLQRLIASNIRSSLHRELPDDIDKLVKHCLESFDYSGTLPAWLSRRVRASFLEAIQTCFGCMLVISVIGAIVSFRYGSRYPKSASDTS
ncbi:major facilitator superfamily domain-containing protein [Aspergillus similis]